MRVRDANSFVVTDIVLVQHVRAIGKPPDGVPCFFRDLRNVVVMPAVGASVHVLAYVTAL